MSDAENIVKSIDKVSRAMSGAFAVSPYVTAEDKKLCLKVVTAAAAEWEGLKKLVKEKEATFTPEEKSKILADQAKLAKHITVLASQYPEKMKDFAGAFEAAKTKPVLPSGFNPDLDGSKAQGDQDGKELEKTGTEWGKTVKEFLGGAKKTVSDAVDDAKELFNADGTPKTDEQKAKEAEQKKKDDEAAAAKSGKDKGFLDSITDWFSNVNGKEIVGGLAGGGIGYMLGKIFGEGTLGTIAGILMSLGGAVMGRKFAHDHFNGDEKESAGKGGNAAKTGKAGAGGASQQTDAGTGVDAEQANAGPGMTDEELRAALDKYNKEIGNTLNTAKQVELTPDELLDYKLAHPLVPSITKTSKPEVQDDLYGR